MRFSIRLITCLAILFGGLPAVVARAGADDSGAAFRTLETDVRQLAALGDRSSGGAGAKAAAEYIKQRLIALGYATVGSHQFSLPVMRSGRSELSLPGRGVTIPIRPFWGNAVTPPKTPPEGISGPLVYVGEGELKQFNGMTVDGAIVLMDLDSGGNWQHAANLGARALIYLDQGGEHGQSSRLLFEDKFELSPIRFPRFWMPAAQVEETFGPLERFGSDGPAETVRLTCDARWESVPAENIYYLIPGSQNAFKDQLILVDAFYDSTAHVAGLSPGADEAIGLATLLHLADYFKAHPPRRTILLVAAGGHAQSLSGLRELVWTLAASSRDLRGESKDLRELIKEKRAALKELLRETLPTDDFPSTAAQAVLKERIKTEADQVARQLMRLRLGEASGRISDQTARLTHRRQVLRSLLWRPSLAPGGLTAEEQDVLGDILPRAVDDQKAILADAEIRRSLMNSAADFRSLVRSYELAAAVSLHLSSHGDGFGAFNYGWGYPLKPAINRVSAYGVLDQVLQRAAQTPAPAPGDTGMFKDTLRPSRQRSWQSYFLDHPLLGGEITALAGFQGLTFVTTNDARAVWGTPYDTPEKVDLGFAACQAATVCHLVEHLAGADKLHAGRFPRTGFASITGRARFLRQGELFADQPAPGTVLLAYQGPTHFPVMVDHMGMFYVHGLADAKHSFHKVILEGYKFDAATGDMIWAIDKKQTGKDAYRVKMRRRSMETDLVFFAGSGTTLFDLLEPRTMRYLTKVNVIDGRREALPVKYYYSRLDTWRSTISTFFLEPGTPLKLTLSDSILNKKLILLNNSPKNPLGSGYLVEKWPVLHRTEYRVAKDMWTLLGDRIANIEKHGIFSERIHNLFREGTDALKRAEQAWQDKRYDGFMAAATSSWALANRVYDDVESTQKDVLYGVLFYIALFVPFAFCLERLIFSFANIYKRIVAFCAILIVLIAVIYNVHPAFQLAYSPMVVILAFLIMGLSLLVTLIIFFRFEEEINRFHSRAVVAQATDLGRWKAFAAAFLLGVSNLRRRRLRTTLTCATLVILTFTIMSFTSAKSLRLQQRLLYSRHTSYQGILLKNVNWRDLPPEAFGTLADTFPDQAVTVPRVWLEDEDRTRTPRIPIRTEGRRFEAQGMIGLSAREPEVSPVHTALVAGRWLSETDRRAVLLPEHMARQLGIDPLHLKEAVVTLWGMPFEVVGIFAGRIFQELSDLDGEIMTPATFPREVSAEITEEMVNALESGDDVRDFQSRYQHIESDLTVIVPFETLLEMGGHLKGVAIRPNDPDAMQPMAQALVDRYGFSLFSGEPSGTYLYHASDSMSYSGVPNIIIPIVISVFIVLNTMISSVYERKREIAIYTSVGLAPSHVSFLFVAEALAFAVLSTVFGYLLAQTAAKLFAHTPLWAGITVNYSSMASVGAMLLVILVVLVSVIYPSKVAGEIAIPDINRSWTLPAAKGTELSVTLPFLMTYREHRSIGGFLYDYFEGHRDITHGNFSTAEIAFEFVCPQPPSLVPETDDCHWEGCDFNECLRVKSQVWLAPFDFGIMQYVDIQFVPSTDQPGFLEIRIGLRRASGEANAWHRINKTFLHGLRRQLLAWRSLDNASKVRYEALLEEAERRAGLRIKPGTEEVMS
jgi:hypothetical protein